MAAVLVAVAGLVWKHRPAARAAATVVGILSPMAFFTLFRMLLLGLGLVHLEQQAADPVRPPPGPVSPGQPRVVWIIFDETDYRLAFEQPPAGLKLPEFNRLRGESVFATNAYPPGNHTLLSMPALISGQRVSDIAIKGYWELRLTLADSGAVTSWSQLPSVFSSARQLGVNTALVGWCIPYSRLLGKDLNYCAWHSYLMSDSERGESFGKAMLGQIGCLAGSPWARQCFINLCQSSLDESLTVVTNPAFGLTLLHLPPPHRPPIYYPKHDRFTLWSISKTRGYFNSLVLADHMLGKLRRAMEASGQWNQTWLLVSADHSWRESELYDRRLDLRVPFILKAPGTAASVTYSRQFNTVVTCDLLLAILRREINGPSEAAAWLATHGSAQPTIIGRPKAGH